MSAGALLVQCAPPTEVVVDVYSEVDCSLMPQVGLVAGPSLEGLGTSAPVSTSVVCDEATHHVGSVVLQPKGARDQEIAFEVVTREDSMSPSTCTAASGYAGCIIAKRQLRYERHQSPTVRVDLRTDCFDVPCSATQTCVNGQCVGAELPTDCFGSGSSCSEGALLPTASSDAGAADAADSGAPDSAAADSAAADSAAADSGAVAPDSAVRDTGPADSTVADTGTADGAGPEGGTTYHDVTSPAFWSATVASAPFLGAAFDGRYMYFAPSIGGASTTRLDTTASFAATSSFQAFDQTQLDPQATNFAGAVYDGRYVYLVPYINGVGAERLVVRFDTTASFAASSSWADYDISSLASNQIMGNVGGVFDGRYVYIAPAGTDTAVTRYDAQGVFGAAASWSAFDTATLGGSAAGFFGAIFDGRYVYFVPTSTNPVARFDTTAPFDVASSWATFSPGAVYAGVSTFSSGAFDGRYVYLVPGGQSAPGDRIAMRYDTHASFANAGAWEVFDTTMVSPSAKSFAGATFDGRYVTFAPRTAASTGVVVRYDSAGAFTAASSWSGAPVSTVAPGASGFNGAAFDGRYVYLVPSGQDFARFDAKTPPSMPALPEFFGSFL